MSPKTPLVVTVIIVIAMLPVLAFPSMLALSPSDSLHNTMLWIYPFYVLMSGWLAWLSWKDRPYLTWILLAVLILTHISMWILVLPH